MLAEPIVVIIAIYVNQTTMLDALNLDSDACQLFLNEIQKNPECHINNFSYKSSFVLQSMMLHNYYCIMYLILYYQ